MKICSKCGEKFETGKFCKFCGCALVDEAVETQKLHCTNCGAGLSGKAKFCPKCGTPVMTEKDENEKLADSFQEWIDAIMHCDYKKEETLKNQLSEVASNTLRSAEDATHHPALQYAIGESYYYGYRGVNKSICSALKWFNKSYEAGLVRSAYFIALCHYTGDMKSGLTNDFKSFLDWMKISAKKNDPDAVLYICEHGSLFPAVDRKQLVEKAVNNGNRNVMYILAQSYETGSGKIEVDKNIPVAIEFYKKAAIAGDVRSVKILDKKYGVKL